MKSSYDAHNLPPALTTLQHSAGLENPPLIQSSLSRMGEPSPPPQDSQACGRSKSRGRSRGGQSIPKKRNRAATVQAMSQPLSSQENCQLATTPETT
ncbi:hypothetical protein PSTT_04573 [Puccinia striiformis]|uniref:Uncharacterized protein n=2 Tax=Puccinia striiformis TaxID=27350 RepID=A0A0L0UXF5_9BASI|nr:hypothetical protein PSTG_14885 [Puccinia striiformis f. sp. tritici PST-78]POW12258.1 hypothetical protein PSTT_04573 [Puccinia striiformis]